MFDEFANNFIKIFAIVLMLFSLIFGIVFLIDMYKENTNINIIDAFESNATLKCISWRDTYLVNNKDWYLYKDIVCNTNTSFCCYIDKCTIMRNKEN